MFKRQWESVATKRNIEMGLQNREMGLRGERDVGAKRVCSLLVSLFWIKEIIVCLLTEGGEQLIMS